MKKRILMSAASLLIVFSILSFQPLACILPGLSQVVNADSYSSITSDSQFRDALANGGHYRIDVATLSVDDNPNNCTVGAGKDVVIDLNGSDVNLTGGNEYSGIKLSSGSTLTITGSGSLVSYPSTANIIPLFDANSGTSTLNLEADAEFTNMNGYIAAVYNGATLNLNISAGRYSHANKSQVNDYFNVANGTLNASFTGGHFDKNFSDSYVASGYKKIDDSSIRNYHYTVIKDEAVVTKAPEALKLNWTGEDQALVTAGTATNGTMMYSLTENGEYSADIPVASDIGEYTVYYKAVGTGSTTPSEVASVTSYIKKSVEVTLTAPDKEYDGEAYSDYVCTSGDYDAVISFRASGSQELLDSAPSAVGSYEIRAVIEETADHYGASTEWIPFVINEIALHYTAPEAITGLIYNRSAQELVTPGTSDHKTTVEYALGVAPKAYTQEDGYGSSNPININVEDLNPDDVLVIGQGGYCIWNGTVTVINTPDGEPLSNSTKREVADLYKDASGSLNYRPYLPSVHMPAATWDSTSGYNSFKVVSREGRNVTITPYKLTGEVEDTRVWSSEVPTATSGGTYKVAWRITASDEVDGLDEQIIEVTIGQADPTYVITGKSNLTYTGENQVLVNIEGYGGTLYFEKFTLVNGSYISGGGFVPEIPEGKYATKYMIFWYSDENENYKALGSESNYRSLDVEIGQAENSCTPPEPVEGLVYDGNNHDLVTAGTAEHGTMLYSLEQDGTYSGDIPVGCDAGTYTVWYKVEGDEGYASIEPQSVEVTIGKMPIVVTLATGNEYVWGTWVTPYERFSVANVPDSVYEELKDAIAKCIDTPSGSPSYYNVDTSANVPGVYTFGLAQYWIEDFAKKEAYSNYVLSFANTQGSFTITPYDLNNIAQYGDRAATITYGEREFTYDGGYHRAKVTVLVPYDKADTTTGEVERLSSNMHINYSGSYQTQVGGYSTIATVTNCEGSLEITWRIVEADPEFTAPTGNRLIYNGSEQQLVTAGTTQHGGFVYALDGSPLLYQNSWNLNSSDLRVGDVLNPTTYFQGIRLYNGTFIMGDKEVSGDGYVAELCFSRDDGYIVVFDPDGRFIAQWDSNEYNSLKVTKIEGDTVTMVPFMYVEGADPDLTEWSDDIPTRSAIGEYTVRYKLEGDWNHKDSPIGSVEAVIREEQITDITDLAGYTLSLEGDIGVKFYVAMKDELLTNRDAQMVFTVPEGNKTTTQIVRVADVVAMELPIHIDGKEYYPFKCTVSAKEMASVIKAQMMSDDVAGDVYEFTVKGYADYLLANPGKFPEFENAQDLVKAMLNYGAAAQVYFGVEGTGPANSSLSEAEKDLSTIHVPSSAEANYLPAGVTFVGASLGTKTKMTLSLYFTGAENATFKYGGEEIEPEIIGGYQVICINDLYANNISGGYTVFVDGGYITYSPLNYCYKVDSGASYSPVLKNLCKAIYQYAVKADEYFAQQG